MRHGVARWLAVAALLLGAGCELGEFGNEDGGVASCDVTGDSGTLNCARFCSRYCDKLASCGVQGSDSCAQDCRTVLESGASQETYACVIQKPCAEISNCGI